MTVEVAPGVYRVEDTCAVYLIVAEGPERTAVAIDFGAGRALEELPGLGISRITDVLMTHHHRDQGQGLPLALAHGARIHVPPVEVDLFERVDQMWRSRTLDNCYTVREDRFSLLEPVPVTSTVPEYRRFDVGGVRLLVLPTPGHTVGSVSYLLERDGRRTAFTGDLVYGAGKVWSLAATQWSYTENEGPAMTVLSCWLLAEEAPEVLLPSHGRPIPDAVAALELLAGRMQTYVDSRRPYPWDLRQWLRSPYVPLTEHLLLNHTSLAASYVLLSRSGEALVVDYGYDLTTGLPYGTDRAARRPWLASLPALKATYGVRAVTVALPTHYHDDHVAGMPLLREVEGTEIWAPANVAPVLADPWREDLPCQWFEPIHADRVLPLGESFRWQEYTITVHDQPGHTRYAAAYSLEVDGVRVIFTGDQQDGLGVPGIRRELLNYQYRNRFSPEDFRTSAALYRRVAPGLMLSGHWAPRTVDAAYLDDLAGRAEELVALHADLLPSDDLDLASDAVLARLVPYRSAVPPGGTVTVQVEVRNPLRQPATVEVVPVLPTGWAAPPVPAVAVAAGGSVVLPFVVTVGHRVARRERIAVDLTIGALRLGQHAEALVDVVAPPADRRAGPVLGLDIGGTKLAAAVVTSDGTVLGASRQPTRREEGPDRVLERLFALGRDAVEAAGVGPVVAVGVSCGGPLDATAGVLNAPLHLPGWHDVPVVALAEAAYGVPAALENDATAAALGEYRFGHGQTLPASAGTLLYLTLSTGVGGGAVVDGRLHRGAAGNGGEFGHLVVVPGGRTCLCGRQGCLERYVSGTSIADRAREALQAEGIGSVLAGRSDVRAEDVVAAVRAGDALASRLWCETTELLATALTDLVNAFEPDLVVLGGGVTRAGSLLLDPLRTAVGSTAMSPAARAVRLELTALGDAVGVVGAAAVAFDRLTKPDPTREPTEAYV
ncbi:ROK family protein [uncultured Friedmanniella sp.]|uniref:ROK family protein n=1 Tax=uncultured Friedmanniella sp. TaxID=335381 RepID=UPI0035CA620E